MGSNELILNGIGTCRFCGQAVAVKPEAGETPDEAAVRSCDCPDARRYRLRKERVERSQEMINEMFGTGCEETYETKPIPEETIQLLKLAAVLAIDGKLTKATVQVGGICKAEIGVGGKGEIKVKRTEGRTISTEE